LKKLFDDLEIKNLECELYLLKFMDMMKYFLLGNFIFFFLFFTASAYGGNLASALNWDISNEQEDFHLRLLNLFELLKKARKTIVSGLFLY
jgi:hypothetical protein